MTFVRTDQVRFEDCDPAGIAFYPRLVAMVNRTVEDWFAETLGQSFHRLHVELGEAIPVASMSFEFKAPAYLGERLTLALHVERIGRTSVSIRIDASTTVPCFTAALVLVHVARPDYKPAPWSLALRSTLDRYLPA